MIINNSQKNTGGLNLQELLSPYKKEPEELLSRRALKATVAQDPASIATQSASSQSSSSNLMSHNFASADQDESKYLKATKNSFHVSSQMNMEMKSTATAILESLGGIKGASLYDPHGNRKSCGGVGGLEWQIRRHLAQKDAEEMMKEMQEELKRKKEAEKAAVEKALVTGETLNEEEENTISAPDTMGEIKTLKDPRSTVVTDGSVDLISQATPDVPSLTKSVPDKVIRNIDIKV